MAFLSACAFALAIVLNPFAGASAAALGVLLLTLSFTERDRAIARYLSDLRLTAALIAVALVAILVPYSIVGGVPAWVPAAVPSLAIVLALAALFGRTGRRLVIGGAALIVVGLITGALLIRASGDSAIDVVLLHQTVASALARGENIYGPAVTVPSGAPGLPPGSTIVGYPYPPVVAVAYAAGTWLFGDPRWTNLVAWAVLGICALALFAGRQKGALPFLLIASVPGRATMLQSGWTEMLSAALVALAAVTWSNPVLSGIALGLALGSKQYFAVALPLLLLHKDSRPRRAPVALATAAIALLPAFIAAPGDAWRAMVLSHARTPPRSDSTNLAGLLANFDIQWAPPAWLAVGAAVIVISVLARRVNDSAGFWRACGGGLAVFFLLSSQAMPNYWYLVAVIVAIGAKSGGEGEAIGPYGERSEPPLPRERSKPRPLRRAERAAPTAGAKSAAALTASEASGPYRGVLRRGLYRGCEVSRGPYARAKRARPYRLVRLSASDCVDRITGGEPWTRGAADAGTRTRRIRQPLA